MAAQLFDQWGRPIDTPRKPDAGRVAVARLVDRYSTYPSRGLTPERLGAIFREADEGDLGRQAELFAEFEEKDGHLASVLQTRKLAVIGLPRKMLPYGDDPADLEAAELVDELLEGLDLDDVLLDLLDAVAQGYSIAEIVWELGARWRPVAVEHVAPGRFAWDLGLPRLLTDAEPSKGQQLAGNKFVVHVHKARSGVPYRGGCMRPAAWLYLFKNYALKDWVQFVEIFGHPLRLGKYDPAASKEDRDALLAAVQSIGTDAAGVIANTTSIDFPSGTGSGTGSVDLYDKLLDYLDRGLSKIVLGQTLTTDTSGSTGTYAAGSVHNQVRRDLLEADARALARTVQRDLIRPLVGFNLGWERTDRLPRLEFDVSEPEDLKALADTYAVLVKDVGLPIAAGHVRDRFGVPAPAAGDELVTGPKSGAPASAGDTGGGTAPDQAATELATRKGRTPTGALVLSSDSGPTIDADKLEAIIAASAPEGATAVDAWVAEVKAAADQARDLAELERTLLERYPAMKLDAFRAAMDKALVASMGHGAVLDVNKDLAPWAPVPFDAADEFFATKVAVSPGVFAKLRDDMKMRAFAVSGLAKEALLADVYRATRKAISEGTTLAEFRADIKKVLDARGWQGKEHRWKIETIFRTNVLSAYSAGHYKAMKEGVGALPYWQYDAVGDSNTRPEHAAMDGKVFAANDPIWDTWYPPNGFNCRCTVRAMSQAEVEARGLEVDAGTAYEMLAPDPGFGHNPGRLAFGGLDERRGAPKEAADARGYADYRRRAAANIRPDDVSDFPAGELLPPGLPDDVVRREFLHAFRLSEQEPEGIDKDFLGSPVFVSDEFLRRKSGSQKSDKEDHGEYVRLFPSALHWPDEIWLTPMEYPDGRVELRRRYVKLWKTPEKDRVALGLVMEVENGRWVGTTGFKPKNLDYVDARLRRGVLLYGR